MSLRNLCRAVLDRTYFVPADDPDGAYSVAARAALADVLDAFADSIDTVSPQPVTRPADQRAADRPDGAQRADFSELLARRDELATFLLVDPWPC